MLLGDAAGFVDPITREGIFFALTSADRAADALLDGSGDPARVYDSRVRDEISNELVRAARLKARFFAPRFMGMLVTALQRSDSIRTIMADLVAGHQTYRGLRRRLIGTLEFRLMAQLFGLQRLD
jgi:flavin-dependent dehydrogenase